MYALTVRAPASVLARKASVFGTARASSIHTSTWTSGRQLAWSLAAEPVAGTKAFCPFHCPNLTPITQLRKSFPGCSDRYLQASFEPTLIQAPISFSVSNKQIKRRDSVKARMASAAALVSASEEFVQGEVLDGGLAVITLARPKALNAMNLDMDRRYTQLLDSWQNDSSVKAVLVQGSTPRAFCSGADVKWFATAIRDDPATSLVEEVFRQEYPLIVRVARYPKPYVSIMDGITMGFGLGLSGHGKYRVITERTVIAMPENGIGLFPDVGFATLVARAPRGLGNYMALTGARLKSPADILYAGLASHYVPSEKLPELRADLESAVRGFSGDAHASISAVLDRFASPPGEEPSLRRVQPFIERVFDASHPVTRIRDELERAESSGDSTEAEWAAEALAGLRRGGPVSLAVTQKHFDAVAADAARGAGELSTIEGVMRAEYRLALRTSRRPDFVEGVRAVLIDKDQKPRWLPSTLDEVKAEDVEKCFAPFDSEQDELHF